MPASIRQNVAEVRSNLTPGGISVIRQAMQPHGPPDGPAARWVGLVDIDQLDPGATALKLSGADGYKWARLLLRRNSAVLGYATLPITAGSVSVAAILDRAAALPEPPASEPLVAPPPISVVVCTRERPQMLRESLGRILAQDYPRFEIIVVDNAPVSSGTADAADELGVRYVVEPKAGLSRARNAGLAAAEHDIVAFTDDDTAADPRWLEGIARGFTRATDVACVSGVVPSGELRNSVQSYFDARVSWSKNTELQVFRLAEPPPDIPLFPFSVGRFGTGANFAVRARLVRELGSFDEALGVGTRTQGGEDLDIFTRTLLAGHTLVVEPTAIMWHRHRDNTAALRHQAVGYGRGLGAWLLKLALRPRTLGMALRRLPGAVGWLLNPPITSVEETDVSSEPAPELEAEARRVRRLELAQVLVGPPAYVAERWRGHSRRGRR
jgi:glycosyltransferase involved in cell wall biosynthesis